MKKRSLTVVVGSHIASNQIDLGGNPQQHLEAVLPWANELTSLRFSFFIC